MDAGCPCPAHVAVSVELAVNGRFVFDSLLGGYTSCLLTLGFHAGLLWTSSHQRWTGQCSAWTFSLAQDGHKICCFSAIDVEGQKVKASIA